MKKIIALLSALIFVITGCSSSETAAVQGSVTGQGASINSENNDETELQLSMNMTKTLNPLLNSDETVNDVFTLMYENLVNIGEDGKAEPNIADSWTFDEDGKTAHITLKSSVSFSDGSILTADDVIYSLRTIDNAENSYYKSCTDHIKNWSAQGSYQIDITFYDSGAGNMVYLAFPVISSAFYGGDYAVMSDNPTTAVTTGLYRFESFSPAKELMLTAAMNDFKGQAAVNKITVTMTKDRETQLNLFTKGITDILPAEETELAGGNTAFNGKRVSYITNVYDFIGFNFNNAVFMDRNIRQAIAYSLDIQNIIDGIYLGNAERAYSPVRTSSWLYDSSVYGYDNDLTTAKMLVEQSGWRFRTSQTVRENEDGRKLQAAILVNKENSERCQVAQNLASALNALGFEVSVTEADYQTYMDKIHNGSYDIFVGGWTVSPSNDFSNMFGTDNNVMGYSSSRMDEYISECSSAVTDEEMMTAYGKLQNYISQELPYISLVYRKSSVYMSQRIHGDLTPVRNRVFNGIENITVR